MCALPPERTVADRAALREIAVFAVARVRLVSGRHAPLYLRVSGAHRARPRLQLRERAVVVERVAGPALRTLRPALGVRAVLAKALKRRGRACGRDALFDLRVAAALTVRGEAAPDDRAYPVRWACPNVSAPAACRCLPEAPLVIVSAACLSCAVRAARRTGVQRLCRTNAYQREYHKRAFHIQNNRTGARDTRNNDQCRLRQARI